MLGAYGVTVLCAVWCGGVVVQYLFSNIGLKIPRKMVKLAKSFQIRHLSILV